jgi:hypothetical protein
LVRQFRDRKLEMAAEQINRLPRIAWQPDPPAEAEAAGRRLEERLTGILGQGNEAIPRLLGTSKVLFATSETWPHDPDGRLADSLRMKFDRTPKAEIAKILPDFLDSLGTHPSADVASYLSAVLIGMDEPEAAIPFARMADSWNPRHPYAAVNLLRGLEGAGRIADAKAVAESLSSRTDLDEWASMVLKRFVESQSPRPQSPPEGLPKP